MKYFPILLLLFLPLVLTQCSTTENTPRETRVADDSEVDFSQYRNLADYLRRLPGVQVRGTGDNVNIQIRGTSSFGSETRPLFVLDGRVMGNSYSEVNRFLNMSEVNSIRVLTDSEAGSYGMRGANGVIVITRKR